MALFGALSLISAFSPDLQTLVILRFLTGLGLGGANMPNTITMTLNTCPPAAAVRWSPGCSVALRSVQRWAEFA